MHPLVSNLFQLPPWMSPDEQIEILAEGHQTRIERILSMGHTTPLGQWYDQDRDEWVILIQGEAELVFENGLCQRLTAGDYLLIPAHCRHRVERTSTEPPCIWLAVHGVLQSDRDG